MSALMSYGWIAFAVLSGFSTLFASVYVFSTDKDRSRRACDVAAGLGACAGLLCCALLFLMLLGAGGR